MGWRAGAEGRPREGKPRAGMLPEAGGVHSGDRERDFRDRAEPPGRGKSRALPRPPGGIPG